ncbi:Na+/H+ antiporter NhaA [Nocardioides sp. cx-173]|uniref:Na+/H+ antiporter NhaA n=1 Tax=Nocardioides sp. cx-173 TaxID=2898796 RepID=UPI001E5397BF|nr:Na+/H+ antiporter NhaA [Nocardioides sp. cx-173]MCD4524102.1 Na+/H+ antiporter NhaA [Nocardioides sp. cx-173]UGB41499.1 Na+/H+ antiporter NhaA [Nocardioides sp. cx-173]
MAASQTPCSDGDLEEERQVAHPLRAFIRTESGSAGILVVAALVALVWANSPWSGSYEALWHKTVSVAFGSSGISMDLHHWVNDGLMVVFFFVIGLEVRRELSLGELTDRRRVTVPLVAGVIGMLVPAALFLALNPSGEAARGWGIVIGTDTAFLLGVLALVGPAVSTQLRIFLLTLTVIDDIVAVSVIGLVYSDSLDTVPLTVAAVCLVLLAVLARVGEWRSAPYVVVVLVLWLATLESGLHASIAGMLAGLLIPALEPSRGLVDTAASQFRAFRQSPMPEVQRLARQGLTRVISVNERLQEGLHGFTSYVVVPVFALANAGVDLRDGVLGEALRSSLTWGVVVGLVVGKTVGIGLGALGSVRLGLGRLPQGVGTGHVIAGGALSGIGFTVSLLIVGLALDTEALRAQATVGVLLAAVLASAAGWLLFRFAARFLGQHDAALPRVLSDPVDPGHDHIRGPVDADLTLVEYLDFECSFCAKATGAAEEVRRHFGDRLRYVARHLPLVVHPHAELAAMAAEAAGAQGRYWDMHDLLFRRQDELELQDLIGYAADLGLDVERFVRDLESERLAEHIRRDVASADASGVRGTPTFFVGDLRVLGPHDARSLIQELEGLGRHPTDPARADR